MELRFEYSLPDSRGCFLSISLPIFHISVLFLRGFESHYNPGAAQKDVSFRYLLLKQEIYLPNKEKDNILGYGPHDGDLWGAFADMQQIHKHQCGNHHVGDSCSTHIEDMLLKLARKQRILLKLTRKISVGFDFLPLPHCSRIGLD